MEKESIAFSGRIGEIVHTEKPDGRVFERYRRAPGTRIIVISPENKILLNREFRHESGAIDLRLPGGKVCDTIEEFTALRESGKGILQAAKAGAIKEARQETGLVVTEQDLELVTKANAGATVEWDLYYFVARHYHAHKDGHDLSEDEATDIKGSVWLSPAEIRKAIADNQMEEWRSVGVLLGLVIPALEA